MNTLQVTTPSDREITMTRSFNAPRDLVFEALTKPALVQRWLLGPPGWTMPVCEIDLRVGGAYRYVWRNVDGREMGMGGIFREISRPDHLVHTEKFDTAWYPGEALVTNILTEQGGKTTLAAIILYDSREARDSVLKSGMESSVAVSYDRLEEILSTTPSQDSPSPKMGEGWGGGSERRFSPAETRLPPPYLPRIGGGDTCEEFSKKTPPFSFAASCIWDW